MKGLYEEGVTGKAEGRDVAIVEKQLALILESPLFLSSERMSTLLRYIVNSHLNGSSGDLKETSIGVAVFGRLPSYDPKVDPVVRNEVRRLRNRLHDYYERRAPQDQFLITIPKGRYTPCFAEIPEAPASLEQEQPAEPAPPLRDAAESNTAAVSPDVALPGVEDRPVTGRISQLALYVSIFLVLSVGLAALLHHFASKRKDPKIYRSRLVTSFVGQACNPAIAPRDNSVAFSWDKGKGNFSIFVVEPGGIPLAVTSGTADYHPAWSPSGGEIAFLRSSSKSVEVAITGFPGGSTRSIFHLDNRYQGVAPPDRPDIGPEWMPNGSSIVVSNPRLDSAQWAISAINLASGQATEITRPVNTDRDFAPSISPDGKWLAFSRFKSFSSADIYLASIDHPGYEERITNLESDIRGLSWMRDGKTIIFSSNYSGAYTLWTVEVARRHKLEQIPSFGDGSIEPSVSPSNGTIVYTDVSSSTGVYQISLAHPGEARTKGESSRSSDSATFSPDGRQFAFASNRSGTWEIWLCSSDGEEARPLTHFSSSMVGSPRWSPDGTRIAFDARPSGHSSIFVVATTGGSPTPLTAANYEEKQPSWSLDGQWIYFDSNAEGREQLWKQNVATHARVLVADEVGHDPQEGPGGELYFANLQGQLMKVSTQGGRAVPIAGLEMRLYRLWQATPQGIYFIDPRHLNDLFFYELNRQEVSRTTRLPLDALGETPSLSVSPDGNKLLITAQQSAHSDLVMLEEKR